VLSGDAASKKESAMLGGEVNLGATDFADPYSNSD
jgi:hypothetical protein